MKKLQWFTRHQWWSLTSILALFSVISFGNMTKWSIWFDEAFSVYLMRFDYVQIARFTGVDVHPPFYYWLLKFWTSLWQSTTPLAVRSLSWCMAIIALVGVFVLVLRVANSRGLALLATLGAALTPIFIRYSEEARMYTLSVAIVIWATYAMLRAMQANSRKWWGLYAVLVMLGMLTHYLIALVWIVHWIWRASVMRRDGIKKFFSREWIYAHLLAVGLYLWWLPTMIHQFTMVQGGFWIAPVRLDTLLDFVSNSLLYRMSYEALGWWAVLAMLVIGVVAAGIWYFATHADKRQRNETRLLVMLAVLPPVLLLLISLPPMKSTFVDRYLVSSSVLITALAVGGLAKYFRARPRTALIGMLILVIGLTTGIANVYRLGNMNKNNGANLSIRTADVIEIIRKQGESGQPVVAANPWIYYEAAAYDSIAHPVYYPEKSLQGNAGSLAMLKENDMGKIKDLNKFAQTHRYLWYLDSTDPKGSIKPPISSWKTVKSVGAYDSISHTTRYRAVLFDTQS